FPAAAPRVVALWADATAGVPPLPASLWSTLGESLPTVDAPWQRIGVAVLPGPVLTGVPQVATFTYIWPAEVAAARQIAIVALVTSEDDRLEPAEDVRL